MEGKLSPSFLKGKQVRGYILTHGHNLASGLLRLTTNQVLNVKVAIKGLTNQRQTTPYSVSNQGFRRVQLGV